MGHGVLKFLNCHIEKGEGKLVMQTNKPIVNPLIVLREEFDDCAVLFDPDSGDAFGLNPIGCAHLRFDGNHSGNDILKHLQEGCEDIPVQARAICKNSFRTWSSVD